MAHEVENMFYMGETPWHGLGIKLDKPPTVEEALKHAGLDWRVERKPLVIEGTDIQVPAFANVRSTDQSCLGVVGARYEILQNADAFGWFRPFLDSGEVELHTAGSLANGARIWILAKILTQATSEIVPGDEVLPYLLLSTSHDGLSFSRAGLTAIRAVCANTVAAAHSAASSKLLRVKHTKNAPIALDMVRKSLDLSRREFLATMDGMRAMARVGVNEDDLKHYVREVFEVENGQDGDKAADRLYNKIIPMFEGGRGANINGVKGTLWGAYNAVTEYLSWERGRTQDTRLESLWFGESAAISQKALDTAMLLAA